MSEKKESDSEKKGNQEVIIRIQINNQDEKSGVIVALGASNHYTDKSFSSDTCCTCSS